LRALASVEILIDDFGVEANVPRRN
jgi:hypothetical protein